MNPLCPHRNNFCFVCGLFVNSSNRHKRNITKAIRDGFFKAFRTELLLDREWYTPDVVCIYCTVNICKINKASTTDELAETNYKFTRPVLWLERTEHLPDSCYFCVTQQRTIGMHFTDRFQIKYAEVESVYPAVMSCGDNPMELIELDPQEYAADEPMDFFDSTFETCPVDQPLLPSTSSATVASASSNPLLLPSTSSASVAGAPLVVGLSFETASATTQSASQFELTPSEMDDEGQVHRVTQDDFNDLVRDLGISLRCSEILGSRLKHWNLTTPDFKVTSYRNFEERNEFKQFFALEEKVIANQISQMAYCTNVTALFEYIGVNHVREEWRLFIDGSTTSLKAVLLHNGNEYPSVPLAYATNLKEEYHNMETLLQKINYAEFEWKVCCDLKMIAILIGLKSGYPTNQCFLCEWEGRLIDLHYINHQFKSRIAFKLGEQSVIKKPLIRPEHVILPPLHLKLGLVQKFVCALEEGGPALTAIKRVFPKLSNAKIVGGEKIYSCEY